MLRKPEISANLTGHLVQTQTYLACKGMQRFQEGERTYPKGNSFGEGEREGTNWINLY